MAPVLNGEASGPSSAETACPSYPHRSRACLRALEVSLRPFETETFWLILVASHSLSGEPTFGGRYLGMGQDQTSKRLSNLSCWSLASGMLKGLRSAALALRQRAFAWSCACLGILLRFGVSFIFCLGFFRSLHLSYLTFIYYNILNFNYLNL